MKKLSLVELTGKADQHVVEVEPKMFLHRGAVSAWKEMVAAAAKEGFRLALASAFRSYERQLGIWNAKVNGERPLLDEKGQVVDVKTMPPAALLRHLLRWSAIPGSSRHHWGTDMDVFDAAALTEGYRVMLTAQETAPTGIFGKLHLWLDENLQNFGFYRPYAKDRGGVSPERWHLSYAPLAEICTEQYTLEVFESVLGEPTLALRDLLWKERTALFKKYIINVEPIIS